MIGKDKEKEKDRQKEKTRKKKSQEQEQEDEEEEDQEDAKEKKREEQHGGKSKSKSESKSESKSISKSKASMVDKQVYVEGQVAPPNATKETTAAGYGEIFDLLQLDQPAQAPRKPAGLGQELLEALASPPPKSVLSPTPPPTLTPNPAPQPLASGLEDLFFADSAVPAGSPGAGPGVGIRTAPPAPLAPSSQCTHECLMT
jgi:hypothetical protein